MQTNSKTPKGPQQEPFLLRNDAERAEALRSFLGQYRLKSWPIYSRQEPKKPVQWIERKPKNKQQKPTPQNHARLLLEMYPKRKALKIAKQYLKCCKLNSKKHRLWAGVFWILNDLGPLPKGLA